MPSVLISGANRGIGLEFARQYAAEGWRVHGTLRNPADAAELRRLGDGVVVHPLDVTSKDSVDALAAALSEEPIDLLIANAGAQSDLARPLDRIDRAEMIEVLAVNAFGALALAGALLPNLRRGAAKKAIAISSLMSSIGLNDWGTQYVYRASKTALNALWVSLALEWRADAIACVLVRPGLVRTRMTNFLGDLTPEESVGGMRQVIAGLTLADSGRLISYDGNDLPW
jgi:NAD(P)-dependent dehydrogenase (short-subunit alcohol dehydrogenase family)